MIDLDQYDYLDIGCSSGGAQGFVAKLGGKKGVGITLDKSRLKKGAAAGLEVVELDPAERENYKGKVRLSIISRHIERLETYAEVVKTLSTALHVTRNTMIVRSPWFDSDGANLSVGVKTFWSDWKANRFSLTSLHMLRFLLPLVEKGGVTRFVILGFRPIASSADEHILPLSAERDSGKYDAARHGLKPAVDLPIATFVEMVIAISCKDPTAVDIAIKALGETTLIFDSAKDTGAIPNSFDAPAEFIEPDENVGSSAFKISKPLIRRRIF